MSGVVLERDKKIGEGAYGIVYSGKIVKHDEDGKKDQISEVVVKRNYGEPNATGIKTVRELHYLASLRHPFIVKLESISDSDPFQSANPMTPRPERDNLNEDKIHFVMEHCSGDLDDYYRSTRNFHNLKIVMCQILLALEYIHAKGISHRDLGPKNVLVSIDPEDNLPRAKICDFGLSGHLNPYIDPTLGTVTGWYRAPEICCGHLDHNTKIDIWSAGCVFYEMILKKAFINVPPKSMTDSNLFKKIIRSLPEVFTRQQVKEFISRGVKNIRTCSFTEKKTFEKIFQKVDFDEKSEFIDLINHMLVLDPHSRFSATECINHPFFSCLKSMVDDCRKYYPPDPDPPADLEIIFCFERAIAVNEAVNIFNKRLNYPWYSHQILFHALRLFDLYLSVSFRDKRKLRRKSSKNAGRLHTRREVKIRFYTCIYLMYKYFAVLENIVSWKVLFPDHLRKENIQKEFEDFESYLIKDLCGGCIYEFTFLEYAGMKNNPEFRKDRYIRFLLQFYAHHKAYTGNFLELYTIAENEFLKRSKTK